MNSNIRCIEIQFGLQVMFALNCWIVTLDVLKSKGAEDGKAKIKLNSNIRCIEMRRRLSWHSQGNSWIVTLDVLKLFKVNDADKDRCWIVTLDVLKL